MPRTGPRRPQLAIRLSAEAITALDQLAVDEGKLKPNGDPNRSEMARLLLAHGWRTWKQARTR